MNLSQERWRELSGLLDEALVLPPAERVRWAESRAGVDEETKNLLRQILGADQEQETLDILKTMPRLLPPTGAANRGPDTALEVGVVIAGYRLQKCLGTGGMGTVWLAERVDGLLKRSVALKLPHAGMVGPRLTERWHREREILSSLEHPNIARLYDAGISESGQPYLALEFVAGEDIKSYCDRLRLPVRARIELFLQVLAATQYAHSRLVVHRDIKPSNVLVNEGGQAVLLDFGIAKVLEEGSAAETVLTREIGRLLTPEYASPEQISGGVLTTASDVYSLGVVLFELLTGERPYPVRARSRRALEDAILHSEPQRASACVNSAHAAARGAAPAALARALRGDVDTILAKALKKRAEDRYRSVDAFASDLQNHLRGLPVSAQPESAWYRARKFAGRNRLAVGSATTVLVALAVGLGGALWQSALARAQADRADDALRRQAAVRALYVETMAAVANADPQALARPGAVMRLLRDKLQETEPLYKDRPQELLGLLNIVCVQLNYAGDFEGALEVGRRYLALIKTTRADPEAVVEAHMSVARNLAHLGRYDEGEKVLRVAVNWDPQRSDAEIEHARAEAVPDLAWALLNLGRRPEAQQVLSAALPVAERSFPDDRYRLAIVQMLGRVDLGYDDAAALSYARWARDRYMAYPSVESTDMADTNGHLGMALLANGRPAEAETALRDSARRAEELFGAADRDTVKYQGLLASALARQGKHEAARQLLDDKEAALRSNDSDDARKARIVLRGRQIENAVLYGDPVAAASRLRQEGPAPGYAYAHTLRDPEAFEVYEAQYLEWMGRGQEALQRLTKAQAQMRPAVRQGPAGFRIAAGIVQVRLDMGQAAEAQADAAALVRTMREAGAMGSWTYRWAVELSALAEVRADPHRARDVAAQIDAIAAELAPPSGVDLAASLMIRAQVYRASGRSADAQACIEQALALLQGQHARSPRRVAARLLAETLQTGGDTQK